MQTNGQFQTKMLWCRKFNKNTRRGVKFIGRKHFKAKRNITKTITTYRQVKKLACQILGICDLKRRWTERRNLHVEQNNSAIDE